MFKFLFVSLIFAITTGIAEARFVELTPSKDSGLYGDAADGNSNRGDGGRFDIGIDDSVLIQFDLSSTDMVSGEMIIDAVLEIFSASSGPYPYSFNNMVAYPVAAAWQEGTGTTTNTPGSTGFPWGPASIGDVCYNYQEITGTDILSDTNRPFDSIMVATSGVPWTISGCKGLGTDLLNYIMIDEPVTGRVDSVGQSIATVTFTDDGLYILNAWQEGSMDNNGICMFVTASSDAGIRTASREFAMQEYHPRLTLEIYQTATIITIR